jgi:cytochrome c oxidase assembly factor CtaG
MYHLAHANTWTFQFALTPGCVLTAILYLRGWLGLRSDASDLVQRWRAASFLLGVLSIWIAVASPLASFHAELLTAHMVQHLLIMTVGAPLILLGAPAKPILLGLPACVHPSSGLRAAAAPRSRARTPGCLLDRGDRNARGMAHSIRIYARDALGRMARL